MAPGSFAAFLVAAVALILTPGPDTFYVLDRGLGTERRQVGLAAAAGVSTGILVHTTAVVLGLSALLRASPAAYDALRYAGAAYLLALGALTLWRVLVRGEGITTAVEEGGERTGNAPSSPASLARGPTSAAYAQGVAVNVLNPKVAVFFLAFLPQFAGADAADLWLLGGWYAGLTMGYLGLVALSTDRVRALLADRSRVAGGLRAVSGLVLLAFGVELALGVAP